MERRNTIQRELVLGAVRELHNHATADEVYECVVSKYPSIGKGTVYRNLNILAEEGEVRRIEISGGPDRFDHNCAEHYHVACMKCAGVFDVDVDNLPDLIANIRDKHGIDILSYDILFKGICPDCRAGVCKEE